MSIVGAREAYFRGEIGEDEMSMFKEDWKYENREEEWEWERGQHDDYWDEEDE